MLVPISWLNNYIKIDEDIDAFCSRMIMSGSNIETVQTFGEGISGVIIGKILKIEKHPNADKLVVCQVDVGTETVQIVTGATNVFEGAYVPVVMAGGVLPGGIAIRKGKLRDVESDGMLCSAKELGIDDKVIPIAHKDGIFILDKAYTLGQDVMTALDFYEKTVEFEITPNRPDCLSMLGMAREAAAVFGGELTYPVTACLIEEGMASDYISVEIKKPELCRRYTARVVKDIKIAPSPWWLQKRLITAGMRPINNIVDVTNYVMLEYGQPIHAFDLRMIAGNKIVVDAAEPGQSFTTLDGTSRKLTGDMLLINDGEKAVAIAGIMGGLNSEILQDTTTTLIESANFNGDNIRSSSKKLGLRTEASARFEKGIDANLCAKACDRVCSLIEEIGAGKVVSGAVDAYLTIDAPKVTAIRTDRVNSLLGISLSTMEMESILHRLEMKTYSKDGIITVTPPTVRQDLSSEIDFVEEIARIYGYDNLPTTLPKSNLIAEKSGKQILRDLARDSLVALGMNEIQTYSFANPKGLDNLNIPDEGQLRNYVKLLNPLGEDSGMMRTSLAPNMMEVLGRNYSRNIAKVKAFEIGNVFLNFDVSPEDLPTESEFLSMAAYGDGETFFTLKGVLTELFIKLGVSDISFIPKENYPMYHFGRCASIVSDGAVLGIMGEVHPDVTDRYNIDTRVYNCELDLDKLYTLANIERLYSPLPKYPAVNRDIALLVSEDILVDSIEAIIRENAGTLLEKLQLFDVYRGKQVKEGHKSVAFTLTYRDVNKTLTDDEVVKVHQKVLDALRDRINAVLREV